jgi:hypothetical protein
MVVTRQSLGTVASGDEGFGTEMLDKFFHTLESHSEKPSVICFYTEGVKVVCEGSPHVMGLRLLGGLGVRFLACQSCLNHYGLFEKLAVGHAVGMKEILQVLMEADKVVTI